MNKSFFPKRTKANPIIYAYSDLKYPEMLKVGLYNTVLSKEDFELLAKIQAKSL